MTVKDIYDFIDFFSPYSTQFDWDNSGISTGSLDMELTGIVLALDCTDEAIDVADKNGCNLIITHHPLIFTPLKRIEMHNTLYRAIQYGMTVLSAHTNLDMADGGVNDVLADKVGLRKIKKIFADNKPIMRSGEVDEQSIEDFAKSVAKKLGGGVTYTPFKENISRIAVCSGSGGEYIKIAAANDCDVLLTGEAKHHEFLEAKNLGIGLMTAGHYNTEVPAIESLYSKINKAFPYIKIFTAEENKPYETVV